MAEDPKTPATETTQTPTTQTITEPKTPATEPKTAKPAADADDGASSSKDPQPGDDGLIKLSPKNFAKRLARMTNREMKKIFGTADFDKILQDRKDAESLRAEKADRDKKDEETRRAAMKEEERLKEDNAKLSREKQDLERALKQKDQDRMVDAQQHYLEGVAGKHVDADSVDYALGKFKKYLRGMTNSQVEDMDEASVGKWFQEWSKEHPKHAIESKEPKEPKPKVPLNTGTRTGDKPAPATGNSAPKKPKEMTKAELAAYMKERGYSQW
jgi:hypothetical protein